MDQMTVLLSILVFLAAGLWITMRIQKKRSGGMSAGAPKMSRKNAGRSAVYGQGPARSDVFRPLSLEAQIVRRHQEVPPKVGISKEGIIVLDANAVLDSVGFSREPDERMYRFYKENMKRIRIGRTAKSEIDLLMASGGTPEMYKRLEAFDGAWMKSEPSCKKELVKLEKRQRREIDTLSEIAMVWLYEKQRDAADIVEGKHPLKVGPKLQKEALEKLFEDGAKDRIIAAKAHALAKEQDVILITSDQDILIFAPEPGRGGGTHSRTQADHPAGRQKMIGYGGETPLLSGLNRM